MVDWYAPVGGEVVDWGGLGALVRARLVAVGGVGRYCRYCTLTALARAVACGSRFS